MNIHTASEKTELLRKIAGTKTYTTTSKEEKEVVENEFEPQGLVDVFSCHGRIKAACCITDKGMDFLANDEYIKQEQEEQGKRNLERLAKENMELTNKKLKYELHTRWIAVVSLIASAASVIITIIA